ncbi:hypothetical protein E2I00_003469 [Balaenoptera physalus]|uniref:PH domain-containing protein n=1 Tax=Balaenoptera physalus TaxID=9770 RepID=A0A6A1Q274_BALPH|nr:hypothetical protein E2I00_003469 [Balaenoptera physalus]
MILVSPFPERQLLEYKKISECIKITTVSGNEFLLQSDIDFIILDWFNAIKNAIDRLPKDPSSPSRNLELFKIQRSSSTELLSHYDSDIKEQKPENRKSLSKYFFLTCSF